MLFGKLLEGSQEDEDNDLFDMEQKLRAGVEKAKALASACKMTVEPDEYAFLTAPSGVLLIPSA